MIELKNISFYYSKNHENFQIEDLSLFIDSNSITGIFGESGGGKSTLAKLIAGIIQPKSGEVIYNFSNEKNKANPIQMLFQNSEELINPARKVFKLFDDIKLLIDKELLFDTIGITDEILQKRGFQLSGGERQKVGLARIMQVNPKVLIVDEPFASQDYASSINFINLFKTLQIRFNTTIICISHSDELLNQLANRKIEFNNGKVISDTKMPKNK